MVPLAALSWLIGCAPPEEGGDGGVRVVDGAVHWEASEGGAEMGMALADLDRDGLTEVIVSVGGDVAPGPLRVYRRGSSVAVGQSAVEGFHGHLDVGDVDGDGWLDVVVSRYVGRSDFSAPGGVDLYRGRGDGTLEPRPSWSLPGGAYSFGCALADGDGDGWLDLAIAAGEAYTARPEAPLLRWGGDLSASTWSPAVGLSRAVAWSDADGDGWLDLAVAMVGEGHRLYRGGPGGLSDTPTWIAAQEPTGFEGTDIVWGDFSGDGIVDLVVAENAQLTGAGRVRVFCGPSWSRCWESEGPREMFSAVALRDIDGDGAAEILAGVWWGNLRIYQGGSGETIWESHEEAVAEAVVWGEDLGDGCIEVGVSDWQADRGSRLLAACF